MSEESLPEITKEEAKVRIEFMLQTMRQAGGVSNEGDIVKNILKDLEADKISPEDAVSQMSSIEKGRRDRYSVGP